MTLQISIVPIDPSSEAGLQHISEMKILLASVLPVTYPPPFYRDLKKGLMRGFLAMQGSERVVGAIVTREEGKGTHIMALGVLAVFRGRGIGTQLMGKVLGAENVLLYVQTSNEEAIQFYKKLGFQVSDRVEKYYRRTTCDSAFKMERQRS